MQDQTEQTWQELCKQASTELDPDKLLALVQEINRLLEERRQRMTGQPMTTAL